MKRLILLIAITFFMSCETKVKFPIVITDIQTQCCKNGYVTYYYHDSNGNRNTFEEKEGKYTIGEVIKLKEN